MLYEAELTMGQRIIGRMGHQIWMNYMGHGSGLLTTDPTAINVCKRIFLLSLSSQTEMQLQLTARDLMSRRTHFTPTVFCTAGCLSVRLSVCLSHADIVSAKRSLKLFFNNLVAPQF